MHYALRSLNLCLLLISTSNLIKIHHHQRYITLVKEIGKGNLLKWPQVETFHYANGPNQ